MPTPEEIAAAQAAEAAKVAAAQAAAATPPPVVTPSDPSGEPDESKLDVGTKAYIQKLRKENARYRTEAKANEDKLESVKNAMGVQGESETPEQQAMRLIAEREQVAFENAVLTNAIKHGVSEEGMELFQFMLEKAANGLAEGEELPGERIAEIAKKAKAQSVKPLANTTVTAPTQTGGAPPPVGTTETVTVEKFVELSFGDRVKLYETNQALYEQLMAQATQKRLIK